MFDYVRCLYTLPDPYANAIQYQTKDTPCQQLNLYEIREDGTLWHEEYDIEDRSERGLWEKAHPGEKVPEDLTGLRALGGCMSRVNKRWVQDTDYTGEICFYSSLKEVRGQGLGWIEWSIYFQHGKVANLTLISKEEVEE